MDLSKWVRMRKEKGLWPPLYDGTKVVVVRFKFIGIKDRDISYSKLGDKSTKRYFL